MSLDQSPLAMSSRVGSSGWAMLQRRQDTIRYGCDGGCDNDGVYKGLVFTVIVMQSLSSFHCSTLAKRIYGLRDLCGFRGLFGFCQASQGLPGRIWLIQLRFRTLGLFSVGFHRRACLHYAGLIQNFTLDLSASTPLYSTANLYCQQTKPLFLQVTPYVVQIMV